MSLPIFLTKLKEFSLMQTSWSSQLNPALNSIILNGNLLTAVPVVSGDNTINHKLGRKLQGWFVVGNNAAVDLFDKQATNQITDLTLVLNSSGTALLNLWVF